MDARSKPTGVVRRHLAARGAIDDHMVRQVFGGHMLDEPAEIRGLVRAVERLAPTLKRHTPLGQQHPLRRQEAADTQIELEVAAQTLALGGDLLEQRAPDDPGPDDPDRDRVVREIEARVHRTQCPRGRLGRHDDGDVALRSALRDGTDVHRRGTERTEHLGRDPGQARHPVADDREDREVDIDLDRMDLTVGELAREGRTDHGNGTLALDPRHRATDRVLGAALRDQHHGDALLTQCTEQAVRGSRHTDHPRTLEIDERDVFDGRDALHGERRFGIGTDEGRRTLRREGVADPDRDRSADRRRHGLGMDDLGAEIGQLHRLVIGQRIDDLCVGDPSRIRREHAVDIRPDVDRLGIEQCPEDRGGEIAAVAPQGGLHTSRIAGDETGDDQRTVESTLDGRGDALVRCIPLHHRPERPRLDDDHFARIEPTHLTTAGCAVREKFAEQAGRPDLAIP